VEQRILPSDFEDKPKLTPRRQTLLAVAFVVLVLMFVVFLLWLQSIPSQARQLIPSRLGADNYSLRARVLSPITETGIVAKPPRLERDRTGVG
jgi:flagellar biosynthesis/type III secretory pathway M-ring protein FliF/YscJ